MSSSLDRNGTITPATEETVRDILAAKYFFLAALTMLLYDHMCTFSEEIRCVWKKRKTVVLCIFLLVRYYAPLAMSVVAFGYFSTAMTPERCAKWVLFLPLGAIVPLMLFPGILMVVRVYALWNRNKWVLGSLCSYLVMQNVAGLWQYTVRGGGPAPVPIDNFDLHFCIYLPPKRIGRLSTMYLFFELGFDTLVFLLSMSRTIYVYFKHQGAGTIGGSGLMKNLIRDGIFYFGVIVSMNIMWVLMILYAPEGARAIAALPSACVTTTMICRITLNLRTTVYGPADASDGSDKHIPLSPLRKSQRGMTFARAQSLSRSRRELGSPFEMADGRSELENGGAGRYLDMDIGGDDEEDDPKWEVLMVTRDRQPSMGIHVEIQTETFQDEEPRAI